MKRKDLPQTLLLILGLFAFRSSFADQYYIPSGSMIPTIRPGDRVVVNKMAYDLRLPFTEYSLARLREPMRGDVIVFQHPRDPGMTLIKRLAAFPGDRILVRADGEVAVNGPKDPNELVVPVDHYFFLGDNRGNSSDSRVWGFVPRRLLKGKALKVFYPRIRELSSPMNG